MQSVIDGILAPFTRFEDTLPPDVSPEETGAAFAAVAVVLRRMSTDDGISGRS